MVAIWRKTVKLLAHKNRARIIYRLVRAKNKSKLFSKVTKKLCLKRRVFTDVSFFSHPKSFRFKKMDWQTPQAFFDKLNQEFSFTLDPATNGANALCANYFTESQDALAQSWRGETCYVNPPYGRTLKNWIRWCLISRL